MAIGFQHTIEVRATPERIFGILDDVTRTPEWLDRCTGIDRLTDGPNAVGTRLRYGYHEGGQTGIMEGEITVREADRRLAMHYEDKMMDVTVDFQVSPNGGSTTLRHAIAISPKGLMGKIASPIIKRRLPDQTISAMQKLKTLAEHQSP